MLTTCWPYINPIQTTRLVPREQHSSFRANYMLDANDKKTWEELKIKRKGVHVQYEQQAFNWNSICGKVLVFPKMHCIVFVFELQFSNQQRKKRCTKNQWSKLAIGLSHGCIELVLYSNFVDCMTAWFSQAFWFTFPCSVSQPNETVPICIVFFLHFSTIAIVLSCK